MTTGLRISGLAIVLALAWPSAVRAVTHPAQTGHLEMSDSGDTSDPVPPENAFALTAAGDDSADQYLVSIGGPIATELAFAAFAPDGVEISTLSRRTRPGFPIPARSSALLDFRLPPGLWSDLLSGKTAGGRRGARQSLSAVPEPATWATMILGFACTGALLRRSRAGARSVARAS